MIGEEREIRDAPGCPLLGLAADRRTRHTYPHPGHRCYATRSPSPIGADHQSTRCLSLGFARCDRYQAWRHQTGARQGPASLGAPEGAGARPPGSPAAAGTHVATVIHVWRAGDSLARIAAAYGLTVEQLAAANNLAFPDAVPDGQRLLIPIGRPAAGATGRTPERADGSS